MIALSLDRFRETRSVVCHSSLGCFLLLRNLPWESRSPQKRRSINLLPWFESCSCRCSYAISRLFFYDSSKFFQLPALDSKITRLIRFYGDWFIGKGRYAATTTHTLRADSKVNCFRKIKFAFLLRGCDSLSKKKKKEKTYTHASLNIYSSFQNFAAAAASAGFLICIKRRVQVEKRNCSGRNGCRRKKITKNSFFLPAGFLENQKISSLNGSPGRPQ